MTVIELQIDNSILKHKLHECENQICNLIEELLTYKELVKEHKLDKFVTKYSGSYCINDNKFTKEGATEIFNSFYEGNKSN